jgi:CHAD domain-containing protein
MNETKHPVAVSPPERAPLPAERAPAAGDLDAWRRVRELALRQLDRFMSLEPKVLRGDDPDAIHDIRVASRRLQQIVDLLYPPPAQGEIRKLRRKIRRCRRALSEVRNCDVQLQRVTKLLAAKGTARRESWEAVRHYLRQRRSETYAKALRKLSKVNLAVFYVRLKGYLVVDGARNPAGQAGRRIEMPDDLAPEQFYERVGQALEGVWQAFEAQVELSHHDPRAAVLHGVRIAAKRLRYLIEVFRDFDVPGSAKTLTWLRGLQQHLGNWHDLEVLEQMMIAMVARPEFLQDHLDLAMGVERLILRNRTGKKNYREKYTQMTLDSEGYQQMKDWVAEVLASPSAVFLES